MINRPGIRLPGLSYFTGGEMPKPVRKKTTQWIHRLDPVVSSRIAAGEVIERPASALRELLDNALDSGADRIRVDAVEGGKKLLRVMDNGCGMGEDDLKLCVEKHATSKIRELEDLSRVVSLGFRGEALHAMATVSRLRILSSEGDGAMELCIEGGKELWFREAAGSRGTIVELSRLFFTIPARREFLKSAVSESRMLKRELLERMLARPDRGFEFYSDGKKVYNSPAGSFHNRIADLYPGETADDLLEVSYEQESMRVDGFAAPFHRDSSSRKDQFFFLNGRPVSSASLSHALRSAYGNLMPSGRQPIAFLNLSLDPAEVNVNIHPAKREIRFRRAQEVYSLIRRGVERAITKKSDYAPLSSSSRIGSRNFPCTAGGADENVRESTSVTSAESGAAAVARIPGGYPEAEQRSSQARPSIFFRDPPPSQQVSSVSESDASVSQLAGRFAGMRICSCLFCNYWILEGESELLLVDQHAAHERVLYEQYKKQFEAGGVLRQGLLVPITLELTPGEAALVEEHREALVQAGFGVESFGPDSWALQELPSFLKGGGEAAFRQLLALYAGNEKVAAKEQKEGMLTTLACRSAIKAGDAIPESMIVMVLNRLDGLPRSFSCPHGRPAVITLSEGEIAKWFART